MARPGRPKKWGEPVSPCTIRWPASHRELYERLASEHGMPFSEYVIRTLANLHALDVPPFDAQEEDGQLPLTA